MTMAKVDDPKPPGWDAPPLPLRGRKSGGKGFPLQQLGIRHLMVVLVYFAVVFWLGKRVLETNGAVLQLLLGVLVGLGICVFGVWAAMKLTRYSFIGWIVFIVGTLGITGVTISFFAIPTLPILVGAIVYLSYRRRSNDQDALLWVLTVAAERGMPLAPGVQAFSTQVSGMFEVWAESLAELLRRGATLPEAVDSVPKIVPVGTSLLIRMGWESGNLAAGLREAVDSRTKRLPVLRSIGARIAYLCWVMIVGQAIVGFVMYFIVPKFEAIFKDFGIDLPEITVFVIRSSHALVDFGPIFVLLEVAFFAYLTAAAAGWGSMTVPVFDRLFARRHAILIFRALAVVVDAGRPIPPALYAMGEWYPTRWVRKKLRLAAEDAHEGVDWAEALYSNGLLSAIDVGVLASAQRAGNLAWALRELAESGERRWGYRLQAWTQILFVLAMLVLGGLVFMIAVAYFAPLTTLISRLSR
jgi:type II secretory pathway component PulF